MRKPAARLNLWTYLALTWALSSIFYWLILRAGKLGAAGGLYVLGLMWCPGVAALLTCWWRGLGFARLGWIWGGTRYQVASYFIPLGYAALVYVAVWWSGLGGIDHAFLKSLEPRFGQGKWGEWGTVILYLPILGTLGFLGSAINALGEEIGWRGFLTPLACEEFGFRRGSFLIGLLWSLWHYPVLLFADYNAGTPAWYGLTCFTLLVTGITFLFGWMRLRSGSLWTGMVLHASHNLFIQSFFDPITRDTGSTRYIIGEFGVGLALVGFAFMVYFGWLQKADRPEIQVPGGPSQ